jgi:hypothetical protein
MTEDDTFLALKKVTPDQFFELYLKRFPAGYLVNTSREIILVEYQKFLDEVCWTKGEHQSTWRDKFGRTKL